MEGGKSWQIQASHCEEFAQLNCIEKAELCTDVTVQNSHIQSMKCYKASPLRVGYFLRRRSANAFEDRRSYCVATALKLILEVGQRWAESKVSPWILHVQIWSFPSLTPMVPFLLSLMVSVILESAFWVPFPSSRQEGCTLPLVASWTLIPWESQGTEVLPPGVYNAVRYWCELMHRKFPESNMPFVRI